MEDRVYVVLRKQEEGETVSGVARTPDGVMGIVREELEAYHRSWGSDEEIPAVTWEMVEAGWNPPDQNYAFRVERHTVTD